MRDDIDYDEPNSEDPFEMQGLSAAKQPVAVSDASPALVRCVDDFLKEKFPRKKSTLRSNLSGAWGAEQLSLVFQKSPLPVQAAMVCKLFASELKRTSKKPKKFDSQSFMTDLKKAFQEKWGERTALEIELQLQKQKALDCFRECLVEEKAKVDSSLGIVLLSLDELVKNLETQLSNVPTVSFEALVKDFFKDAEAVFHDKKRQNKFEAFKTVVSEKLRPLQEARAELTAKLAPPVEAKPAEVEAENKAVSEPEVEINLRTQTMIVWLKDYLVEKKKNAYGNNALITVLSKLNEKLGIKDNLTLEPEVLIAEFLVSVKEKLMNANAVPDPIDYLMAFVPPIREKARQMLNNDGLYLSLRIHEVFSTFLNIGRFNINSAKSGEQKIEAPAEMMEQFKAFKKQCPEQNYRTYQEFEAAAKEFGENCGTEFSSAWNAHIMRPAKKAYEEVSKVEAEVKVAAQVISPSKSFARDFLTSASSPTISPAFFQSQKPTESLASRGKEVVVTIAKVVKNGAIATEDTFNNVMDFFQGVEESEGNTQKMIPGVGGVVIPAPARTSPPATPSPTRTSGESSPKTSHKPEEEIAREKEAAELAVTRIKILAEASKKSLNNIANETSEKIDHAKQNVDQKLKEEIFGNFGSHIRELDRRRKLAFISEEDFEPQKEKIDAKEKTRNAKVKAAKDKFNAVDTIVSGLTLKNEAVQKKIDTHAAAMVTFVEQNFDPEVVAQKEQEVSAQIEELSRNIKAEFKTAADDIASDIPLVIMDAKKAIDDVATENHIQSLTFQFLEVDSKAKKARDADQQAAQQPNIVELNKALRELREQRQRTVQAFSQNQSSLTAALEDNVANMRKGLSGQYRFALRKKNLIKIQNAVSDDELERITKNPFDSILSIFPVYRERLELRNLLTRHYYQQFRAKVDIENHLVAGEYGEAEAKLAARYERINRAPVTQMKISISEIDAAIQQKEQALQETTQLLKNAHKIAVEHFRSFIESPLYTRNKKAIQAKVAEIKGVPSEVSPDLQRLEERTQTIDL